MKLIEHHINGVDLPPLSRFYDYVLAGNGLFLRAKRKELQVQFPITSCSVQGLPELQSRFVMKSPQVPAQLLLEALDQARDAWHYHGTEILLHLMWNGDQGQWSLVVPVQEQSASHCKALDESAESSYQRTFFELHSHHVMNAYFSPLDDKEQQGLRLFAVLGTINKTPTLVVRVGAYSYFWNIPAAWVMEVPEQIVDLFELQD